jgi:hypothetical protein
MKEITTIILLFLSILLNLYFFYLIKKIKFLTNKSVYLVNIKIKDKGKSIIIICNFTDNINSIVYKKFTNSKILGFKKILPNNNFYLINK